MKDWLSIGEFSKQTGFSNKALRIYEEKGLLTPHSRSESQYRFYGADQVERARWILHYKQLGFSLEEIKILISLQGPSLKSMIEKRLQDARAAAIQMQNQISSLQSILTSLNEGESLTTEQRRDVMESLLETSLQNLKRRGVMPREKEVALLSREVDNLSEGIKRVLPQIKGLLEYAKKNNIALGPGRATTLGSAILFGEGYAPYYPGQFNLLPELFADSKFIWLDVEYSNYREIGSICDSISSKTGIEVIAYRSPVLDIFKNLEKRIGQVDFDKFRDDDPLILEAPRSLGFRGLWDFDWSPDYEAFREMDGELQKKFFVDLDQYRNWISRNGIRGPQDFINVSCLALVLGQHRLEEYEAALNKPITIPELAETRGLLLYREDWIRLFARLANVDIPTAAKVQRAITNKKDTEWAQKIDLVQDAEMRDFLMQNSQRLFLKSHMISSWWHYRRTAIVKSLWPTEYIDEVDKWEQKNGMIWTEFGYRKDSGQYYLRA